MKNNIGNSHKLYFFKICLIAAIGGFLFGFDTAAISGALPFLISDFHFNPFMEVWFVSSAWLGCITGVVLSGNLSDAIGRKKVMIASAGLFFVAALGSMIVANLFWLILFRIIGGLDIGVASMVCPLYTSEIASPNIRGRMVALYQLAITVGIVAAYFSKAYLLQASHQQTYTGWFHYIIVEDTWGSMISIGLIPSLLFWLSLLFIPESPRWLFLKRKKEQAHRAKGKSLEEIKHLWHVGSTHSVLKNIIA